MGVAEFIDRTDEHAVQQLADKIRAAGHVAAEDAQSCVEDFRVDDDMILKVRDSVSVARRKVLQRGCALMTRRMAVPAVWLHARARAAVCKLRTCARVTCARAARSRSSSLQVCGACSMRDPAKTYSECVLGDTSPAWMLVSPRHRHDSGVDARVAAGARTA